MVTEAVFAERIAAVREAQAKKKTANAGSNGFAEKVARARAQYSKPVVTFDEDLIPDTGPSDNRTPEDDQITSLIDGLDIIEAYRRYIGKMEPNVGGRRESIMISCPVPGHEDKNPSAWASLNKNTWFCAVCERGGDQYDLAAIKFGFDLDSYKRDGSFPELRRQMAEDLGFSVRKTIGGQEYVERVTEAEPESQPEPEPDPAAVGTVEIIDDDNNGLDDEIIIPWEKIIPDMTFLHHWMEATQEDDLPEEFYFWLGMMAVGLAVGNDAQLLDNPTVKSNLFICLFGATGMGKTRAVAFLIRLLRSALPYDPDDLYSTGSVIVPSPGSAESLIDAFSKPEYDPVNPKKVLQYHPVRGLLRFDELSTLIGRAGRSGNVMKPTLMEFYDSYHPVDLKTRGSGYVCAEDHFCSTVTSTQMRAIRNIIGDDDAESGFLNRWIFAMGREKKMKSHGAVNLRLDHLIPEIQELRVWSRMRRPDNPRLLRWDDDAGDVWESFFHEILVPIKRDEHKPVFARLDLTMKKIMLLLSINEKRDHVTKSVVERAILLFPYLNFSYSAVSGQIGVGPFQECREAVRWYLVKKQKEKNSNKDGLSLRELGRGVAQHLPRDLLLRVVKTMTEIGELEEKVIKHPKAGRPTTRYTYVV